MRDVLAHDAAGAPYLHRLDDTMKKYYFPESSYDPPEDSGRVRTIRWIDLPNTIIMFGDYAVKGEVLAKLLGLTDDNVKPTGHIEIGSEGRPIFVDDAVQSPGKKSA